jgi:hypothetical protein
VGAAFVGAGTLGYVYLYATPRAALDKQLSAQRATNAQYESAVKERRRVSEAIKAVASTTLGAKEDQVVARFRSMLNEIAEGAGMRGVQINTRKGVGVPNPVGTSKVTTPSGLRTALRKQTDFTVIEGDLDGTGTLEQVLRVTAMVQAQPWVHRVRSFSIKPEGKERNRFNLSLGVATLMMPPELAPKESSEPPKIESLNEAARLSWGGIVSKNMFREPAPVQVAAAPPQPANPDPPGPAAPPYNEWRLTGIVESRLGLEAMLVNVKSQQRMTLPIGATVAEAKFVSGAGERAVFEIGGQQFEIVTGQTLEQRRPAVR